MLCKVSGKELKSAFIDIASLFKKYDRARVVGIDTTSDSITFTVDTGTYYTRTIRIHDVVDGLSTSITVLFTDLSNFITAREDVEIELSQYFVTISSKKAKISLSMGESIVAPYKPRGGKEVPLAYNELNKALRVYAGTTDLQKAFSREFAINFYGNSSIMRSHTIWIQTFGGGLVGTLSLEQLKSIVAFQPTYVQESDRLEFYKEGAILSIPKLIPVEKDNFMDYCNRLKHISVWEMDGIQKAIVDLRRNFKSAQVTIHLYEVGFALDLSKSGITIHEEFGSSGQSIESFNIMLDIFSMCLNLMGESENVHVYKRGDLVCLVGQETRILMSV